MAQALGDSAFWILTALAPGRLHGYAVLLSVAEMSADSVQLKPTTLYAVLDRLERDGLVLPDGDEVVSGRMRRYFALTDAGEARLRSETAPGSICNFKRRMPACSRSGRLERWHDEPP